MDGSPPYPDTFYCELCRLSRADPYVSLMCSYHVNRYSCTANNLHFFIAILFGANHAVPVTSGPFRLSLSIGLELNIITRWFSTLLTFLPF